MSELTEQRKEELREKLGIGLDRYFDKNRDLMHSVVYDTLSDDEEEYLLGVKIEVIVGE